MVLVVVVVVVVAAGGYVMTHTHEGDDILTSRAPSSFCSAPQRARGVTRHYLGLSMYILYTLLLACVKIAKTGDDDVNTAVVILRRLVTNGGDRTLYSP